MKKEQVISIAKTLLTLVGSFLIGKKLLGVQVDDSYLGLIVGSVITAGSFIWSLVDKSLAIEGFQSAIKQVLVAVGGVLVASGKLDSAKLDTYLGAILPIATLLYTILSQKKSAQIASGQIAISDLKGVSTKNEITPTISK